MTAGFGNPVFGENFSFCGPDRVVYLCNWFRLRNFESGKILGENLIIFENRVGKHERKIWWQTGPNFENVL